MIFATTFRGLCMLVTFTDKIKYFLSGKIFTFLVLTLAIISRLIQLIYFFNIRVDRLFQVLATQNFVYGYGISIAKVFAQDLTAIIYEPLIKWPPGYSFLLAPFYTLFNHNYILACLSLDILSAIALIFFSRRILFLLELPVYLVNIYTLTTGFFLYYFYFITSSDGIAITIFIIALYYSLLFLKTPLLKWKRKTLVISALLFLCAFIKYMFIPVIFVIPIFLVLKGMVDKQIQVKRAGIFSFLILVVGLLALLLYQKYISGEATYVSDSPHGFFPANLLAAYPFLPASLVRPDTIALLLNRPGIEFHILKLFQWIYLFLVLVILVSTIFFFKKLKFKKISLSESYFYLAIGTSLTLMLLFIVLSLRIAKAEDAPGHFWTFIEDPRYYGLPIVLLHMGIFVAYHYSQVKRSRFLKYLFYISILLLLPEILRGIIFSINRIKKINDEEYSWQYDYRFQKYADSIILNEKKKYSTSQAVVTGSSYYMNNRVSLYSHVPLLNGVEKINDLSSLKTKTPVVLLVVLQDKDILKFNPFLSGKGKEVAGYFNGFSFYSIYVTPH